VPTEQILQLLIAERDKLNAAIEVLQGGTTTKRRGRPPGSGVRQVEAVAGPVAQAIRKKRNFSPAQREAARKRMKAYWLKKKKAVKNMV